MVCSDSVWHWSLFLILIQFSCCILVSKMTENIANINTNSSVDLRSEEDPRNVEAGIKINTSFDFIIKRGSLAGKKITYVKSRFQGSRFKVQSVKVQSTEDQSKWHLPDEMTEYVNSHFQVFLPDKCTRIPLVRKSRSVKYWQSPGNLWFFDTSSEKIQ